MNKELVLLYYDWLGVKSWFRSQTLSKVLVLLAFVIVFLGFAVFLYFFSSGFFTNLGFYKQYGVLTSRYLIEGAVVIVSWFVLAASLVSNLGSLIKNNLRLEYLLSQPVKTRTILRWIFIKAVMSNFFLLSLIFSPIMFAFGHIFWPGSFVDFAIRLFFVLGCLTLFTTSLSLFLSYFLASLVKKRLYFVSVVGITVFFLVVFSLVYFIFPKELTYLVEAPPGQFFKIYRQLPLSKDWLPSTWIADIFFNRLSLNVLFLLILTITPTVFVFRFQKKRLISLLCFLTWRTNKKTPTKNWEIFSRQPLVYKDWLSVKRSPAETGYLLFLFSIAGFFFFFLLRILIFKRITDWWRDEVIVFSFVWLIFFSSAFLLRLVFPLMAKEGVSSWYIFTLPVSKLKILLWKVISGLLITLPLLLFSFLLWFFIPLQAQERLLMNLVSFLVIIWLSLVNVLLGSIFPNFNQGADSEKVSTSGMGIITLIIVVIITIFTSKWLYQVMKGTMAFQKFIFLLVVFGLTILISLFSLARYFLKDYQF